MNTSTYKEEINDKINDKDLYNNKYSIKVLEKNIDNLTPKDILRTQKLDVEFCVKYMLNEDYHWTQEEIYVYCDFNKILGLQPHINKKELYEKYYEYYN